MYIILLCGLHIVSVIIMSMWQGSFDYNRFVFLIMQYIQYHKLAFVQLSARQKETYNILIS